MKLIPCLMWIVLVSVFVSSSQAQESAGKETTGNGPDSFEGVYAFHSAGKDAVGRVTISHRGGSSDAETYKMVWEFMGNEKPYVGVGFLSNNVLTAGWPSGVARLKPLKENEDTAAPRFVGIWTKFGESPRIYDHSLSFMRPLQKNEYLVGDVVAVKWEDGLGYWYYAKVVDDKGQNTYAVNFLTDDEKIEVTADKMMRYYLYPGFEVQAASQGDFYYATVSENSGAETWQSESDTVTVKYLSEEGGKPTGEVEQQKLGHLRFDPSKHEDAGSSSDGPPADSTGRPAPEGSQGSNDAN